MEIWEDIPGYNGLYQASNMGRVRSVDREVNSKGGSTAIKKGRILKQKLNVWGYCQVSLYSSPRQYKSIAVHRLVASVFIPNPDNLPEVNHKDGNKLNNSVENLEWITRAENCRHMRRMYGAKVFSEEEIRTIRSDKRSQKEIALDHGVTQGVISRIKNKKEYADIA